MFLSKLLKRTQGKLMIALAGLTMVFGVGAAVSAGVSAKVADETTAAGTTTVWLTRPSDYDENNPKIYAWGGSGTTVNWLSMTWVYQNNLDQGVFKYDLPSGTTNFLFQYKQKNTGYKNSEDIALPSDNVTGYYQNGEWYEDSGNWKWRVNTYTVHAYTVKYNGNGATSGSVADTTNYTNISSNRLAGNSFARSGYTFSKWNTKADGSGDDYDSGGCMNLATAPTGNTITLYAKWTASSTKTYSIYFKLTSDDAGKTDVYLWNGGKNNGWGDPHPATKISPVDSDDRWYVFSANALDGGTAPANMLLREPGNHEIKTPDITIDDGGLTGDLYYDRYSNTWKNLGFNIAFNKNSGTGSMSNQSVQINKTKTISTNSFTRTGYSFAGWATSSGGSVVYSNGQTLTAVQVNEIFASKGLNGTLNLYAKWSANTYTITLNNDGATTAGSTAIYEKYATGFYKESGCTNQITAGANKITVPEKTGYTFGGYYTVSGGTGEQYLTAEGYLSGTASTSHFSAAGTLYAKWTAKTFTISYNANGGSGSAMDSSTLTYNSAFTLSSNAYTAPAGHAFASWNTKADGTGINYTSMDMSASQVNTLFSNGSRTLYAIWQSGRDAAIAYAVAFNTAIGGVCKNAGNTNRGELEGAWETQVDLFNGSVDGGLEEYQRYWLLNSRISGDTDGAAFYAKYDWVVAVHGEGATNWDIEDFLGRKPDPRPAGVIPGMPSGQESPLTTTLWIVLASGIVGLGAIGTAYFVSKKRKRA